MTEVAEAWVDLKPSTRDFGTATVRQVGAETEKAGRSLGSRFGSALRIGAVAAVGGGVLAGKFLYGAVQQASDLNETISKTRVIFGQAAPAVLKFSRQGAAALGQTKQAALDAAGTFGTFGKAAGLQGRDLSKFSTGLVGLTTDLSSFYNTSTDEAAGALGAALRGEGEPIRKFGVLLDDATLKAEALRLGLIAPVKDEAKILAYQTNVMVAQRNLNEAIKEHGKGSLEALKAQAALGTSQSSLQKATEGTILPLTQQEKVLAAQSAIMRQTKDAQGDFARTSGGLANQQRILGASFSDLKTRLGTIFLPIVTRVVKFLNAEVVPVVGRFIKQMQNGNGAGGKFASVMSRIGGTISTFVKQMQSGDGAGGKFAGVMSRIGSAIGSINFTKVRTTLGELAASLAAFDWSGVAEGVEGIEFGKLAKGLSGIDFGGVQKALGSGLNDTLSVFGVLVKFAADHVDTLAKYLPLLIGAFIAYKTAQAAANVVDLIRIPLLIAQVVTNRAATKSSAALTAALTAQTTATVGATTAEKVGLLTRLRATAATIASTIASKAAAAAAKAWAAVQWLLNAALTANPIGLVVLAIAGLVAAFVLAWRKSEAFRSIVTKGLEIVRKVASRVFDWLSNAVGWIVGFIKKHWSTLVMIFGGPLGIVVGLVVKNWSRIRDFISTAVGKIVGFVKDMGTAIWERVKDVARFVVGVKEKFGNAVEFVKGIPGKVLDALGDVGGMLFDAGKDLIKGLIDGIKDMMGPVADAVGKVAEVAGKFWPGSPIKEGPLKSWNNGGAGKRLVGLLAQGMSDTSPVEAAARNLAGKVRLGNVAPAGAGAGLAGAVPAGVQINVDKLQPHDYRAFMGDLQRRTQRVALGGFA